MNNLGASWLVRCDQQLYFTFSASPAGFNAYIYYAY